MCAMPTAASRAAPLAREGIRGPFARERRFILRAHPIAAPLGRRAPPGSRGGARGRFGRERSFILRAHQTAGGIRGRRRLRRPAAAVDGRCDRLEPLIRAPERLAAAHAGPAGAQPRTLCEAGDELLRCAALVPGRRAPPGTRTHAAVRRRQRDWDHNTRAKWRRLLDLRLLPDHLSDLSDVDVNMAMREIDNIFWGGAFYALVDGRPRVVVDRGEHGLEGIMRERDYPIALVEYQPRTGHFTLRVQSDPAYYPRYAGRGYNCDGVLVRSWQEHLLHILAHEMLHMVRLARCPDPRGRMYPPDFRNMNLLFYGHTDIYDGASDDDDGAPIEISP